MRRTILAPILSPSWVLALLMAAVLLGLVNHPSGLGIYGRGYRASAAVGRLDVVIRVSLAVTASSFSNIRSIALAHRR